jgi:hypothetical protein
MAVLIIPVCEVCGKQGAVEVDQNETLQRFLGVSSNKRNGFEYGELIGGGWVIYCEACKEKSARLRDSQDRQRQDFFLGK